MSLQLVRGRAAPMAFTRFCSEVLRVELSHGQRILTAVAFDGIDPCDLPDEDRAIAAELFGPVERIPASARATVAAMCGARAGKSLVLCGHRALHLALVCGLDSLAAGEAAAAIVVSPDVRLARLVIRYVSGAIAGVPAIARCVVSESADAIMLRRPDGGNVEIVALPATRGGSALRGRSLVFAAMDEACFLRDINFQVNDSELYKALAPRIMPGGQLVICSTPWAELGLLWETVERNFGNPIDAIAVRAPTLLLRDDAHTRSIVERERERDPANCEREFDARPMSGGTSEFFDAAALRASEVDAPLVLPRDLGPVVMGLDTGFRKDPTAAVIAREHGGRLQVVEVVEHRPAPGKRLVPSEVLSSIVARAREQGADSLVCDQHYVESTREHAGRDLQLIEAPGGLPGKVEVYTAARTALHEGRCEIGSLHRRLLAQLRAVVARPTPGGGLTITSPRRAGSHGDLASAWTLAIWQLERHARDRRRWTSYTPTTHTRQLRIDLGVAPGSRVETTHEAEIAASNLRLGGVAPHRAARLMSRRRMNRFRDQLRGF